jgi:hypothetical protein
MARAVSDLLEEYDELTEVVANSTHTLHQAALSKWFSLLDDTPGLATEVSRLERLNDLDVWYRALEARQKGHGIGSTSLELPADRESSLGMQIALFRRMARLPEFSAVMQDKNFLAALEHAGVKESLRTGIRMTLRLQVKEEKKGEVWLVKRRGRSVVQDVSPKIS